MMTYRLGTSTHGLLSSDAQCCATGNCGSEANHLRDNILAYIVIQSLLRGNFYHKGSALLCLPCQGEIQHDVLL